jgi:hypothetical protein
MARNDRRPRSRRGEERPRGLAEGVQGSTRHSLPSLRREQPTAASVRASQPARGRRGGEQLAERVRADSPAHRTAPPRRRPARASSGGGRRTGCRCGWPWRARARRAGHRTRASARPRRRRSAHSPRPGPRPGPRARPPPPAAASAPARPSPRRPHPPRALLGGEGPGRNGARQPTATAARAAAPEAKGGARRGGRDRHGPAVPSGMPNTGSTSACARWTAPVPAPPAPAARAVRSPSGHSTTASPRGLGDAHASSFHVASFLTS